MQPLTMTKEEAQSHWMWPMIMVSPQSDGGIKVEIRAWTESVTFPPNQVKAYGDKVETSLAKVVRARHQLNIEELAMIVRHKYRALTGTEYGPQPAPEPALPQPGLSAPEWPSGCFDPTSCARHRRCMYAGCIHAGTPLAMPHDGEYPNLAAESPVEQQP